MARESAALSIDIKNMGPLADSLARKMPDAFQRALFVGIQAGTIHLSAKIKNLLEGPVLNRRTGRLWRSIQPEVYNRGGTVVGIVGTDVEYAPVHEFGATIRPKSAGGVLVFKVGDRTVFAREVKIPRRPYVSRAFKEEKSKVFRLIRDEVLRRARAEFQGKTGSRGSVLPVSQRGGVAPRGL